MVYQLFILYQRLAVFWDVTSVFTEVLTLSIKVHFMRLLVLSRINRRFSFRNLAGSNEKLLF